MHESEYKTVATIRCGGEKEPAKVFYPLVGKRKKEKQDTFGRISRGCIWHSNGSCGAKGVKLARSNLTRSAKRREIG
jgi:hypothetical protein